MYYLDENMVQVWEEKRYRKTFLLNHNWRTKEDIVKKGFKIFYQLVTPEQLLLLKSLKGITNEDRYNEYARRIGEGLFSKLVENNYLTRESTHAANKTTWHSQAGEYLHRYLKSMYGIEYPERPSRILLLPTLRCNGDCVFCITDSKRENPHRELDADTWERLTRRVCRELNPCSADLVGGEPLIRFGVALRIIKVLIEHNTLVKVITNGLVLANCEKASQLSEVLRGSKHNIQFSLDGGRETHNRIRPGVDYDRVIRGIKNVSAAGLTFGINLTINRYNIDELEGLVETIIGYGPAYVLVGPLQISPKAIELCKEIMIDKYSEEKLRFRISKLIEKYPNTIIKYDKEEPIYEKEGKGFSGGKKLHTCTAFIEELSIGPEGNIIPCLRGSAYKEFWGEAIDNYHGNLQDLWLASDLAKKFRTIALIGKCAICKYNQYCNQGCPLETYILHGVLGGFDPHCQYLPK